MAGKHGNVTRFKAKKSGMAKLRTSPQVLAELERRADNISAAATTAAGTDLDHNGKAGMTVDSQKGKSRARASVRTGTRAAMEAEATDRALSRTWQQAGRQ